MRNARKSRALPVTRASNGRASAVTRRNVSASRARPGASKVLSVRHAIEILRCLSNETPLLGITDIASVVGMHKSSVSRIIATLAEDDLVERDAPSRRIRLGPGLLSLVAPLLGTIRIVDTAMPELVDLAQRCGETISVSVWDGAGAVNLEQVLGRKAVKHYAAPGSRNPAHATASGKLLLAFASAETGERLLARDLRRFTPRTICTRAGLLAEIAAIRHQGYATNNGELSLDVGAVAAPARNEKGAVVAAITATVPMYRFTADRARPLIDLVMDAADRVSARLGFVKVHHARSR